MVDSRLKQNPSSIFLCYLHISAPKENIAAKIEHQFPQSFEDQGEIIKRAAEFSYPCAVDNDGVQYSTFVLTDIDSKFRYGFCRYTPHLSHCLCIISYLPWFETFYSILDKITEFKEDTYRNKFLDLLLRQPVPKPASKLKFRFTSSNNEMTYLFEIPDTTKLPSIPANRNLTEYFAKVDPENMIQLFISMLFERRIIVTSKKLSLLTAVIHGSVSLLYPMQWQHIFVPILPPSLLPYCCAPMPFLVGIHTSLMEEVRMMPLDEVVIFNADTKEIEISGNDMKNFPSQVSSRLKRKLSRVDRAFQNDYVSSQFLKALADLIGGYRDALKYTETKDGSRVIFDEEMFLETRTGELKDFLDDVLALQSFQQFIRGRLDLLNDGVGFIDVFEQAVNARNVDSASEAKYKQWMEKARYEMKKGGGVFKKNVGEKYGHLKGIDVKDVKNKLKKKVKDGYKGVTKYANSKEASPTAAEKEANIKRNNSMPAAPKKSLTSVNYKDRRSMYSSLPRKDIAHPLRTPPPRPPAPSRPPTLLSTALKKEQTASVELPRKQIDSSYKESQSEPNISALIDSSTSSLGGSSSQGSLGDVANYSASTISDTDSSPEHNIGCFSNPGFLDPHDDKYYVISTEDELLEHTPITQNNNIDTETNIVTETKIVTSPSNTLNRGSSSLKRTSHISKIGKPNIPIRANTTKPTRPPQPKAGPNKTNTLENNSNDNADLIFEDKENIFDDDFVSKAADQPVATVERKSSIALQNSPFYSPTSMDLLGLDSSLFQETFLSLSEESRSLMSRDHSPSIEMGSNNPFKPDNLSEKLTIKSENISTSSSPHSSFENINTSDLLDATDISHSVSNGVMQPSKLTRKPTIEKMGVKTFNVDPFATFYEEAKKDLTNQTNSR